jgi:muconolactone delta-isomerase
MNPDDQSSIQQLEERVKQIAMAGKMSKYYTRTHGQYADLKDFDTDRVIEDLASEFSTVPKEEVFNAVMKGIFYWYLK